MNWNFCCQLILTPGTRIVLLDAEPRLCLKQHAIEPDIPLPLTDHRMLRFPQ